MTEEKKDQPAAPRPAAEDPRQAMPEQNAKQRAKNFQSVTTGYTEEQAQLEPRAASRARSPAASPAAR